MNGPLLNDTSLSVAEIYIHIFWCFLGIDAIFMSGLVHTDETVACCKYAVATSS